jgi:tetratricopeptide (TPR) repeat protein
LVLLPLGAAAAGSSDVAVQADRLEDEWSEVFYNAPDDQKAAKLRDLLRRAAEMSHRFPRRAEPLVIEGIVLCTLAGVDWGLDSLNMIERSRDRLVKAIDIDPMAMDGAAYVTLGNLYWRLPGWPVSFGDNRLARQYLDAALLLYPAALDTNYFMGDFLLDQEEYGPALEYLERADRAPIRPYQRLSDLKIKAQLAAALKAARAQGGSRSSFFSDMVPNFGTP